MPSIVEKFYTNEINQFVSFKPHQTILYFGKDLDTKMGVICLGVGIVKKIEKGETFDILYMDFGNRRLKRVIAGTNHSRRQIYTTKLNQYAWVYGYKKTYRKKGSTKKQKLLESVIFAKAIQGWYVPKQFDIKKVDPNDFGKVMEDEETTNFINELLKGDD